MAAACGADRECVVFFPPIARPLFRVQLAVSPTVGRMETGGVRYRLAECYVDNRLLMDFHDSVSE